MRFQDVDRIQLTREKGIGIPPNAAVGKPGEVTRGGFEDVDKLTGLGVGEVLPPPLLPLNLAEISQVVFGDYTSVCGPQTLDVDSGYL